MGKSLGQPPRSVPITQGQQRPKGSWTIGLVGRRRKVREAAIEEVRAGEEAVAIYRVVSTSGLDRTSQTKFGQHCLAIVTPTRLIAMAVNYQTRFVLNPVVMLAFVIAHALSPVRKPYVLFEASLRQVEARPRRETGGVDVNITVPEGSWVLRFESPESSAEFVDRVGTAR